jgi:dUTP pyrophosphatase
MAGDSVEIRVRLLPGGQMPERHSTGAAGFDLRSAEDAVVHARGFASVGTGIAIELPADTEAQVRPRSGLALRHGISVLNSPGTIDSDFRGEVRVILFNVSDRDFAVNKGDRVAQMVFGRLADVRLVETEQLSDTQRGAGGFGHTG